jgi:hypothetical protein
MGGGGGGSGGATGSGSGGGGGGGGGGAGMSACALEEMSLPMLAILSCADLANRSADHEFQRSDGISGRRSAT